MPFTKVEPEAVAALNASGYRWEMADVSGSDEDYYDLLVELWESREDFCIIEHDIKIGPKTTLQGFEKCPESLCVAPYPYIGGEYSGLGCTRFRAELLSAYPSLMRVVGEQESPGHPPKHWCMLAHWIGFVLKECGRDFNHVHRKVGHIGNQKPSHRCVQWAL